MKYKNSTLITLLCFAFTFSSNCFSSEPNGNQRLVIKANDLRLQPDNGLVARQIFFIYHDGSFDFYQPGHPASDALAAFAGGGNDSLLIEAAETAGFPIWRMQLEDDTLTGPVLEFIPLPSPPAPPPDSTRIQPEIDPMATPYISYIGRLYPSDDLFFANEDPKRHRLFDEDGKPLGPLVVDIYGQDLLDAGVRANDEQDLVLLDRAGESIEEALIRDEDGVVMPHPGFIGAERQGDVPAGRLLSQINTVCQTIDNTEVCREYWPERLDFTQANQPLIRLRLSSQSREINGAWSGVYFDPARDGEGFSVEFFGEGPDQVLIFWYTYQPDSSGEQLWLIGQGAKGVNEDMPGVYDISFQSTRGGRLTSTNNPNTVERIDWGTAKLSLVPTETSGQPTYSIAEPACLELRLFDIEPLDPSIELDLPLSPVSNLPEYRMMRLTPALSGLEQYCDLPD